MLRDIAPLESGKRTHPDVVELREQIGVDEVPAIDRELRIIDRLLRNLEPGRSGAQKPTAPAPVELGFRLACPAHEERQIELEKVVSLDHVRIALLDQAGEALDRGVFA